MSWCPDCRYEYVDGIQRCSDCGAQLVAELPPKRPAPQWDELQPGFLLTAQSAAEMEQLRALLQAREIPVQVRRRDAKNFAVCYDLYAPSRQMADAMTALEEQGLLQDYLDADREREDAPPQAPGPEPATDHPEVWRRWGGRFVAAGMFGPFLVMAAVVAAAALLGLAFYILRRFGSF